MGNGQISFGAVHGSWTEKMKINKTLHYDSGPMRCFPLFRRVFQDCLVLVLALVPDANYTGLVYHIPANNREGHQRHACLQSTLTLSSEHGCNPYYEVQIEFPPAKKLRQILLCCNLDGELTSSMHPVNLSHRHLEKDLRPGG